MTLSDARLVDGKLRISLRWMKPASDVPITFYKVFWSRLVHGPTNDSILVYHRTVLKVSFYLLLLVVCSDIGILKILMLGKYISLIFLRRRKNAK